MNKNLKIGLIILSVLGVSAGTYFAIKFYKLKQAYKTNLTSDDVIKIVDEKAQDLGTEMEEDTDFKINYVTTDCDTTDPLSDCFEGCPDGQILDEFGGCSEN
jgi:hypothetical protein